MISDLFQKFSQVYKDDLNKKFSGDLESYDILVKKAPQEIEKVIDDLDGLSIKGSIGQGNTAYYPWLGIFDERVSSGATEGFYIVFLFSDDYDEVYLTLNQGSTQQTQKQIKKYRDFVYQEVSEIPGFIIGKLPEDSLVKVQSGSSASTGKKYQETNLFYRKYPIDQLNDDDLIPHFKSLLKVYRQLAAAYEQQKNQNGSSPDENGQNSFSVHQFHQAIEDAHLLLSNKLAYRFVGSLITKPFVILTGLSGSGKTKIAQAFCHWLDPSDENSRFILTPVGSDWTNREPILGYPNALEQGDYVKPESGVLDLLIEANKPENQDKPYFLILDEMNLSHVERYFADFLSAMESGEPIPIHPEEGEWPPEIPAELTIPDNVFIIGTVNIDETTYMFSPKVLDRAQVIEFHVTADQINQFLENPTKPDLKELQGEGASSANAFLSLAQSKRDLTQDEKQTVQPILAEFFKKLKETGAGFGYRTALEITSLAAVLLHLTENDGNRWELDEVLDVAAAQKLLPKLHGSRKKLEPTLDALAELCLKDAVEEPSELLSSLSETPSIIFTEEMVRFPISLEKILRMKKRVQQEGFTSFAEA